MLKSSNLYFVSSNSHKFEEVSQILASLKIEIKFINSELEEIQSNSLKDIAERKAKDAFKKFKKPLIIEDAGLFIDSLNGFPGPYSSYVFKTIGNKGILNLVKTKRDATFFSLITYCDKKITKTFEGKLKGKISFSSKGNGWGYDPIFIPSNSKNTMGQTNIKNNFSHRSKSLKKFSNWYLDMLESTGQ